MEGNINRSISAFMYKKRKLHDEEEEEPSESPPPTHLFCIRKKPKSYIFARRFESDQESDSECTESSSYDRTSSCPKAHECFEPSSSSSSANWGGNSVSCEIDMCSSDSVSFENPNSSISQPLSISKEVDPLDDDYEEDRLLEIIAGYKTNGYEKLHDLDDDILYSNVLPANQDNKRRGAAKKLTIDKEFEQYFSSLML